MSRDHHRGLPPSTPASASRLWSPVPHCRCPQSSHSCGSERTRPLRPVSAPSCHRCCAFSPSPASDDPRAHLLAVGGAAGDVAVFRVESAPDAAGARVTPVFQVKDSAKGITCVRFSPDTSMLAVGGHERHVDVYACGAGKRPGWQRAARCSGHSSTITAVDFSADGGVLQSTSQAYEIIYFDPRSGRRVSHPQRDTAWDTWTCPVGFPVMGIWPEGSDGTDINAVSRSGSGKYLVTAGDDGMVSLFNYPCVVQEAACRSYRGHSSHVMAACFNADDSRVISAGGKDRSVFQFRLGECQTPLAPLFPPPAASAVEKRSVSHPVPVISSQSTWPLPPLHHRPSVQSGDRWTARECTRGGPTPTRTITSDAARRSPTPRRSLRRSP